MSVTTTVTVCEEIEELIVHPAEYAQEKVKRQGVSCLFLPHCCTPAWVTFPECYVLQWVKKRDAWEEIKKTFTCQDYTLSIEDAFERWLRNLNDPVPGFRIITGDLTELFGIYVSAAYEVADPIPDEFIDELKRLARKNSYPFSVANVNQARWLKSDHPLARRIWPGGDTQGITYYNLIIVNDSFFNQTFCGNVSYWVHELVHVHQYNQIGWDQFLERYLSDGMVHQWADIWFEQEAIIVEGQALADCISRPRVVQAGPMTIEQAFSKNYAYVVNLISSLEESGEITVENGIIINMSG